MPLDPPRHPPSAPPRPDKSARLSVRDQTLETLRRRIISLELRPGTPLSENELAQELGVSRTPVRESLILLREEGLVQVFPQIGSFVSRVDLDRVGQAQFVREAIECASLIDAVRAADARDITALRDILRDQRRAEAEDNVTEFFTLDEDFHRELLRVGGHASAWTTVNSAKAHLDRARRMSLVQTRSVAVLIEQHTAIVDALEAKDPGAGLDALRGHLRGVFEDIEQIQAAAPELFAEGGVARPTRRVVTTLS